MFYDPRSEPHNLRRNPVTALAVPRPIGWISTLSLDGVVNLAPYSFFNMVSKDPTIVFFSSESRKHSQANSEESGEFVVNMATYDLKDQVNATSAEFNASTSEALAAGLEMVPSRVVKPPRVALSPIAMECRYLRTIELLDSQNRRSDFSIVLGEVVGIYVDDSVIVDGLVDIGRVRPLARLGYMDYCAVSDIFKMRPPKDHAEG